MIELRCHPDTPARTVKFVNATLLQGRDGLEVSYVVEGPTAELVMPLPAKPYRTDGLWQTTCFELFARLEGGAYLEFNFSPSTQWAAYRFNAYREEMKELKLDTPPKIIVSDEGYALIVSVLIKTPVGADRLGLSAVIEEIDGTKSYWALRHPPGKPDFHHPDCFALELPAPELP